MLLLPISACYKAIDLLPIVPPPPITMGMQLDDTVLTAGVKSTPATDPSIKAFDFNMRSRRGEVQLSGFADNNNQIQRATELAHGVSGVKAVINTMTVKK